MLLTISLYRACCILLILNIRLRVIVQAELLFQPLKTVTNNLPDFSQLLCISINTDELDKITSNMGTIFSNTLEIVAPIKLKKIREKRAAPWYNSYPVMTSQRRVDLCAVRCLIGRIKQAKVSGQKQEYQRQGRDINNTRQKSGSQAQVQSSKVGQSGVKHRDNK